MALLTLAFSLDTATTSSAGGLRASDFNPLIRELSPSGYVAFSLVRFVCSLLVLVWFWPERTWHRQPPTNDAGPPPFSINGLATYFGAVLIIVGSLVKLVAATSNWRVIGGYSPRLDPLQAILAGLVLGSVASAGLLQWHSRKLAHTGRPRLNCREHG